MPQENGYIYTSTAMFSDSSIYEHYSAFVDKIVKENILHPETEIQRGCNINFNHCEFYVENGDGYKYCPRCNYRFSEEETFNRLRLYSQTHIDECGDCRTMINRLPILDLELYHQIRRWELDKGRCYTSDRYKELVDF